jgi:hypothetical protein
MSTMKGGTMHGLSWPPVRSTSVDLSPTQSAPDQKTTEQAVPVDKNQELDFIDFLINSHVPNVAGCASSLMDCAGATKVPHAPMGKLLLSSPPTFAQLEEEVHSV